MTHEQLIEELHAAFEARTAGLQQRPERMAALLDQARGRGRRRSGLRVSMLAAAAAAAVIVAVLLAAQVGGRTGHPPVQQPAGSLAAPFAASEYFLASRGAADGKADVAIVHAEDGVVAGSLPTKNLAEAVLAPDGSKVYGTWGGSPGHIGYYDLATGRTVVLDTRRGSLVGVTVSADGNTLAYEWVGVPGEPEHSTSVIVRNLASGATRILPGAPAGPQVLSMSLSPDGSKLALVPTSMSRRALLIVATSNVHAFDHLAGAQPLPCAGGWIAEPRWTRTGLYALRYCDGRGFDLMRVDPTTRVMHQMHNFGVTGILAYAVIPAAGGDQFAVADESVVPPTKPVIIYDPRRGWAATSVSGASGLMEITSE